MSTIIIDTAITRQEKFAVCILNLENNKTSYKIYDEVIEMDNSCHLFIHDYLRNNDVKKVITDCSIIYLPRVINTIEIKGISISKFLKFSQKEIIESAIRKIIINN